MAWSGSAWRRHLSAAAVACALVVLAWGGCSSGPDFERQLSHPSYYFDNSLPFQPNRIWRLKAYWTPYFLDDEKAMVVKQFELIVHGDVDRKRLEKEIVGRGGDERYLRWFEAGLFPLGNWELRDDARISRLSDGIVVSLRTHSLKEVPKDGSFTVGPVWFPDPVMRQVTDACGELNWDVIPQDTSVGFEVVLQSRELNPSADKWKTREFDSPTLWWKQWSVGQERSIAYRTVMRFKANVARCPMPPYLPRQFAQIAKGQGMGVDW